MPTAFELSESDKARVSTEAAEGFIEAYYTALNGARHTIATFYVSPMIVSGRQMPHIAYNGEALQDGASLQTMYTDKLMPWTHFECDSVNAHVLNPCLDGTPSTSKRDAERNISILVQASGTVRLNERKEGPLRGTAENFVLVPNKEELGGKGLGKGKEGRQWLIQTQNFRIVV